MQQTVRHCQPVTSYSCILDLLLTIFTIFHHIYHLFTTFPTVSPLFTMSHAEGAHRQVEMSPETQQKLVAKDLAIASDDICNACADMDCSSTQVCPNRDCSISLKACC